MACINPNSSEFKAALERTGNPLLAEINVDGVNYTLKATNLLQSPKADQFFNAVAKNKISGDFFWKKMQADLGIPKEQIELLKSFNTTDRNELIANILANYSYTVEINIAKNVQSGTYGEQILQGKNPFNQSEEELEIEKERLKSNASYYSNLTVPGGTNYTENEIATPAITPAIKGHAQFATDQGIGWFRSDDKTIPSETKEDYNKRINETIKTLGEKKVPISVIDKFLREENEKFSLAETTKTRRILEVQSDLFQKGRDKEDLIQKFSGKDEDEESYNTFYANGFLYREGSSFSESGKYYKNNVEISSQEYSNAYEESKKEIKGNNKQNQFLQLLNKDNNWVTFFVKSIIQDSAKKGYEKVLFPSGNTASKVEGHTTLEEFKKQKEDRIKQLEKIKTERKKNINQFENGKITREEVEGKEGYFINVEKPNGGSWSVYVENKTEEDIAIQEELSNLNSSYTENDNEIKQLKQELERVDREGFGALKPIFNFYENTVTNILNKQYGKENVKQVTDEYGNTWNEINIVPEREQQPILLQKKGTESSTASPETIATIKEAAKKMGISIVDLADYAKKTGLSTKSINGVADLVQKVVAVSVGKQNVALTEEVVHIATAMLEQTNPEIITSMISQIGKYKIYKATLEQYKDDKNYQLPNGKPDIRKIKKEAVDKLISEYIIERSEGSTEFPELMEQEPRNLVARWWDVIKDAIRSLYGKTKINIFKDVAERVISGEIEKAELKEGDVYLQKAENPAVDNFFNIIIDKASRLKLIPKIGDKKRHYEFDGVDVAKTITELISEDKNMPERTGLDKEDDDRKAWWGTEGHEYLENYISQALIDKNGYALDEPLDIDPVSELNDDIRKHLRDFAKELIASYKPGTRFLLEKKVVNENVKGLLASTIDFVAIMPDDETGVKVDILDWKFMNINKDKTDDVPWYKQRDWKLQMSEYSKIFKNYGLKPNQLRKARMIPFAANYSYNIPGERKSGLVLSSLEVGKVDSLYETNLYLLPVPVNSESTGNPKVDALLRSLRIEYEKFYKKPVSEEDKPLKEITLNNMSKAIRSLHVKLDFSPLNALGKTFLNNAKKTLDSFEKINYDELSGEEIRKKLSDLKNLESSAKKYADLDSIFLSEFPKEKLSEEDKKTLDSLEDIASSTKRMFDVIRNLQSEYAVWLAIKEGVTTEITGLPAEVEIGTFEKSFLEPTKLSSRIINLAQKLILNGKSLVDIKANKLIDEFKPLLANLEKEAAAAGKSAFNLIGKIDGKEISLIRKVKSSFWKEMNEAITKRNKKFFLENMNVEAYNKKVSATIERFSKELEDVVYSSNEYENTLEREYRIAKLRDSIDINSATFNGYDGFNFRKLFQEFMNEEEQLSDEYKAMSPNALKMWNFLTNLNQRGKDMGYLTGKSISFFPLIEATMIEKFAKSDNKLKETKDFFKDFYTVRAQERANFAKTDPETGKVKREIPKYFTITDRNIDQLSTDLNKVGVLWIKSLLEYENSKNLEDVLLTLHSVEKAKGRIVTDKESNIIYDGDVPKIDKESNRSADLLETIIDDYIYGVRENVGSLGNLKIGQLSEKVSKTQEGKEKTQLSVKKAVETSNTLVQALAVGLKPLIAIPNYFGSNMQAFINSGSFYKFGTFERNNFEVTTGIGLSTIDKGLLDAIVPLNDDLTSEKRRQLAKDKGFISYLGTWTFQDVMQVTNSAPERKLQFANAKSFNDNSMIVDGKIVNIRQYLRAQDRIGRKEKTYEERRALEKSFEARVTELRNTKSLPKVAVIENDKVVLPGVSDEELARYRTVVVEYGRNVTSQMSTNNKADYRRDTIFKSFMMFKNWIIKQVSLRTLGVRKNVELDEWEYGRARAFFSTIAHLGFKNITDLREIMMGTDKGLAIINEMLENKKRDHFLKTGQVLEITEEEFQDMLRQQITNQFKELGLLVGLLALVIAAKAAEPPEDASDLEKNGYKWWAKNLNKITDELAFYYNPLSADSITRGSILPALSLLTKTQQAFWNLGKEVGGNIVDDEELIEKTYPTKYFLDLIPGVSQFQREILPYIDPEFAKEMGIRVSAEARRR